MSESNNAVGDVRNVAEKKQLAECWAHVVRITLGWMNDINDRMPSIAWGATAPHRAFIEFIENMSEETTFEEYKRQAQLLLMMHAQARNDIYDGVTYNVRFDCDGRDNGEWEVVSREEKDVRALCQIWWNNQ